MAKQTRAPITTLAGALAPDPALLAKLGSVIVHAEELLSPDGHDFDRIALEQLLRDPDVRTWLETMNRAALIPKRRSQG